MENLILLILIKKKLNKQLKNLNYPENINDNINYAFNVQINLNVPVILNENKNIIKHKKIILVILETNY